MATHSSVIAWRIPGTGEPGGLPSMGSQSRTRQKRLSSSSRVCLPLFQLFKLCQFRTKNLDEINYKKKNKKKLDLAHSWWSKNIPLQYSCLENPKNREAWWATIHGVAKQSESEVAQSCPTLCDPMDCSLPGSSIHGIFQARILDWVAKSWTQLSTDTGTR